MCFSFKSSTYVVFHKFSVTNNIIDIVNVKKYHIAAIASYFRDQILPTLMNDYFSLENSNAFGREGGGGGELYRCIPNSIGCDYPSVKINFVAECFYNKNGMSIVNELIYASSRAYTIGGDDRKLELVVDSQSASPVEQESYNDIKMT